MSNFGASVADSTGTANDFSNNVAVYVDPVTTGLVAVHLFGDSLAKSQKNLAPNIQYPQNGLTLGAGPTFNSFNVPPKYMLTNGVAGGFELGVADSANMTLIQAIFIPTPPTNGSAPTYATMWSSCTSTLAGFTMLFSTALLFTAYTPSGSIAPAPLAMAVGQWNIVSTQIDSTIPAAPVITIRNHTANTSVTVTGTHAVAPSGSLIYLGGTPVSAINNIAPVQHGFVKVHNVVLNPATDLTTAVAFFRGVLASRDITA